MEKVEKATPPKPNLFSMLKPYNKQLLLLTVLAIIANLLTLWVPLLTSRGIDSLVRSGFSDNTLLWEFGVLCVLILVFTQLQTIVQTYMAERVARDLRNSLSENIADHTYAFVEKTTPGKLLTNLTTDIDSIKMFVSQAIVSLISSAVILVGASIMILSLNWRLGLIILATLPIIAGAFFMVMKKVRTLFIAGREIIDALNKVISESIIGASLIRVLNSQSLEQVKFDDANAKARSLGKKILNLFAITIPVITFVSSLATLIILVYGGRMIIVGQMTYGEFAAFNSYLVILIFPIFIIGFMSGIIAQVQASYDRVMEVLNAPKESELGTLKATLKGAVEVKDVSLTLGDKSVLNHVSFAADLGTKTAIIGPTAAGKTQLLYTMIGLVKPDLGTVLFDGVDSNNYDKENLHQQVGFVFQDSIMFNLSLRENIGFNTKVSDEDLSRAIKTAELEDYVAGLPDGLNTLVSERGTSLSGGQKQRIMLARALSLNPKVLLLDDFTARVDSQTEQKILKNIEENYPGLTLISVTQKISSVESYDQIIVLLEGEIVGQGKHQELMKTSPEYVQIYNSQQSINHYELQS